MNRSEQKSHGCLPDDLIHYSGTGVFDEGTVPTAIISKHSTKAGTWGKLVVLEGQLDYVIAGPPEQRQRICAGEYGVIEPQVVHRVDIVGPVRFRVDFHRKADRPGEVSDENS